MEKSSTEKKIPIVKLFQADSLNKLQQWVKNNKYTHFFDAVISSPPYNCNLSSSLYYQCEDNRTDDEFISWNVDYFNLFDKIVSDSGLIIWNLSYFKHNPYLPTLVVASIIKNTPFTLIDTISWDKGKQMQLSDGRLTRQVELIYVFAKKTNKQSFSTEYDIFLPLKNKIYNYIKTSGAKDERTNIRKSLGLGVSESSRFGCNTTAVYPEFLIDQILDIYKYGEKKDRKEWMNVLDPFAGTGTTGFSCIRYNINFFGIELSENCYKFMLHHFLKKQCYVFGNDVKQKIKKSKSPVGRGRRRL